VLKYVSVIGKKEEKGRGRGKQEEQLPGEKRTMARLGGKKKLGEKPSIGHQQGLGQNHERPSRGTNACKLGKRSANGKKKT